MLFQSTPLCTPCQPQPLSSHCPRVSSRLIAVEQRTCERGLNVSHSLLAKVFLGREFVGRLLMLSVLLFISLVSTVTYVFPPSTHRTSVQFSHDLSSAHESTYASLCGSGMLASTLLISDGPNPVTVRLCLGRDMPAGPMGPWKSVMGAEELGFRSRGVDLSADAMLMVMAVQ